ncbi:MAG: hypothetical protein NTY20_01690 [Candidatus Aenigmarchaeota archaeon]|nr:hypothetical protein [Candidatus Aenigmarchaeota archaeon]
MAEVSVMDILLLVLSVLFLGIGFAMRRLRNKMEVDMRKNIMPYMSMRHMFKHKVGEHKIKKKK